VKVVVLSFSLKKEVTLAAVPGFPVWTLALNGPVPPAANCSTNSVDSSALAVSWNAESAMAQVVIRETVWMFMMKLDLEEKQATSPNAVFY
jgi:hypothetical protein